MHSNHPFPRPASSREVDDDQNNSGEFAWWRLIAFVAFIGLIIVFPEWRTIVIASLAALFALVLRCGIRYVRSSD